MLGWLQFQVEKGCVIWGGVESLLNPCARLDTWLHTGMDPGLGSSLEYKYSVTQFSPGYYCYVKWWDGGPIFWAKPRQKDESGNIWVAPKGATPMFPDFPIFLNPWIDPRPVFDDMTVFHQRGTKNIGYAWLGPCYGLVKWPRGCLSNRC